MWRVMLCLSAVLMLARPAGGAVLFHENFDDGTYADTWDTYNGSSFGVEDGVFVIESGFGADDARAVVKSELWNTFWKEYTVDFDFNIGQTDQCCEPHFAMLFNVQAITEGYNLGQYYQFYSRPDLVGLHRMESTTHDQTTGLAGMTYSEKGRPDLSLDTWYHARLVVQGGTVEGYVGHLDGTYLDMLLFSFDTASVPPEYAYKGPIALKAIGGAAHQYDNIRVDVLPDLDGDGFVGGHDLDLVRVWWGWEVEPGNFLQGDPSGDGFVGGDDIDMVRAHWGWGTPPNAVPEPSGIIFLIAAVFGMLVLIRRR